MLEEYVLHVNNIWFALVFHVSASLGLDISMLHRHRQTQKCNPGTFIRLLVELKYKADRISCKFCLHQSVCIAVFFQDKHEMKWNFKLLFLLLLPVLIFIFFQ